jgi:K+-transporting ATPase ATPase A chain
MTLVGWLQILLVVALVAAAAVPLGTFMDRVYRGEKTLLHPLFSPIEALIYRISGVRADQAQSWREYTGSMLVLNAFGFIALYILLRAQHWLPYNPEGFPPLAPHLAFNTAVSFVSNTNWQSYGGETTMSPLSQMAGLTVQNFLSAATGIALALACTRTFAQSSVRGLGNFWVDVTRSVLYVLLPISIVVALVLIASGVPQTLATHVTAHTLEEGRQTIALGPVASQLAIKQLGTNGGGFFSVNSAHPFENPTAWANLVETWALVVVPFALVVTFGRMVGDPRQGRTLIAAMGLLVLVAAGCCYWAEAAGNPLVHALGVSVAPGNLEGKEVRFGVATSALWAALTTGASNGSVNSMHASYTPLGSLVPLFLIHLGEVLPGGVGSGLYGILVFAVLAVFVAGLMVGRTPEYLGKKIGAKEMKMAMLAVLILPVAILGFASVAVLVEAGRVGPLNAGPRGLSEILYAFTSAGGNNGSALAGLSAGTPFYDTTLGIAMLLGRFGYVIPVMALAGSVAPKVKAEPTPGTFPTTGPLFVGLLVGVILILGGLQFFPALALGPIVEHLLMLAGRTF